MSTFGQLLFNFVDNFSNEIFTPTSKEETKNIERRRSTLGNIHDIHDIQQTDLQAELRDLHTPKNDGFYEDLTFRRNRALGRKYYDFSKTENETSSSKSNGFFKSPSLTSLDRQFTPGYKIIWRRPHQICQNPVFISDGTSQFDICQGRIGDCWFLAALADLSRFPDLLGRVLPDEKSLESDGRGRALSKKQSKNYDGSFIFNFFQFGEWVEIQIDDLLPLKVDKNFDENSKEDLNKISPKNLMFVKSSDQNEFWPSLLEKAYAKFKGSYSNLDGGYAHEAMIDLTGGMFEVLRNVGDKKIDGKEAFEVIQDSQNSREEKEIGFGALVSSNIPVDTDQKEAQMDNGLICGHAYSVLDAQVFSYKNYKKRKNPKQKQVRCLKLRNPWGQGEWTGLFSDYSLIWEKIDQAKEIFQLTASDDGEFWICVDDFFEYFEKIEICHLVKMDSTNINVLSSKWSIASNTAGGCYNSGWKKFSQNPFLAIEMNSSNNFCLINLHQKVYGLLNRSSDTIEYQSIGFMVLKVVDQQLTLSDFQKYKTLSEIENVERILEPIDYSSFRRTRDVSKKMRMGQRSGIFLIVPSTFDSDCEAEFYLRVMIR